MKVARIIALRSLMLDLLFEGERPIFVLVKEFNGIHAFNLICVVDHVISQKLADVMCRNLCTGACGNHGFFNSFKGCIRLILRLL